MQMPTNIRLRRLLTFLLLLVATMILAACPAPAPAGDGSDTTAAPAEEMADEGPKYGGTLNVAYVSTRTDIDVQSANQGALNEVAAYFYETLFDRLGDGSVVGLLVKDWEISDDGLVHTWTLQEGVTFHDGSEFNADVVKWNLDRKVELKKPLWDLIPFESVEVIDPLTVQVTLTRPSAAVYGILSAKTWSMYSPSFVESVGEEGILSQASGTGPFMVEEFIPNEVLRLVKNPNYWQEGLPYLDEVIFQVIPDINTRATMLEAGDVDVAFDLSIQDVARFKGNSEITTMQELGSRQWYITMNNAKAPLNDVKVRQAVNHAVDKEGIIRAVFLGEYAQVANAVYLMPTIDGYSEAGNYAYDPEMAASLLEEAGWVDGDGDGIREKDGEPLVLKMYSRRGASAGDIEIAELVQGMLRTVGVEVEINVLDSAAFVSTVTKVPEEADYDLVNLSVGVFTGDAEYIMLTFYACDSAAPRYYNRAYFCDPEVDALINESLMSPTMEERNAIYETINKMVVDQAPILQLFDVIVTISMRNDVKGFYFEPAGNNWPGKYSWLDR
jgi:ABC-type transport system substrate-binding protein